MTSRLPASFALGAVVAVAFLLLPVPAHAVEVGDLAPPVEGKEFFNCEEMSLQDLRGRVVFLELFSTG